MPAELSNLANLRHLNLSSNPRLTGALPAALAGLVFLQTLDVSGCGIRGSLPAVYAALQQLRELRAANSSIGGVLPGSWGLLKSLQVMRYVLLHAPHHMVVRRCIVRNTHKKQQKRTGCICGEGCMGA